MLEMELIEYRDSDDHTIRFELVIVGRASLTPGELRDRRRALHKIRSEIGLSPLVESQRDWEKSLAVLLAERTVIRVPDSKSA